MAILIHIDEINLRKDLSKAYDALSYARTIQSKGGKIPNDTLVSIEKTIKLLENRLYSLISKDE
jgi:hypothetical protein